MIALSTPASGLRHLPPAAAHVLCPVPIGRLATCAHSQPLSVAEIGRCQAGSRPRRITATPDPGHVPKIPGVSWSKTALHAPQDAEGRPATLQARRRLKTKTGARRARAFTLAKRRPEVRLRIAAIGIGRFFPLAPFLRPFDVLTPSLALWLRLFRRSLICLGVFWRKCRWGPLRG